QQRLHADLGRVHRLITGPAAVTPEDGLSPGNPVEIVAGPFAGLTGKVVRRGGEVRFVVEVEFLRRAGRMEVEGWLIRPGGGAAEEAAALESRLKPVCSRPAEAGTPTPADRL